MSSGVTVSDDAKAAYQKVKMNKKGVQKLRFVVLKLNSDLTKIVLDEDLTHCPGHDNDEKCVDGHHFRKLVSAMPMKDARYLIYEFPYKSSFGDTSKIIRVLWCPGETPLKTKMVYASSNDSLKKSCPDCVELQADCLDDLEESYILQKLNKV